MRHFSFRTASRTCNQLSDWLKIIIKPSVQEFAIVILRFLYSEPYYYTVTVLFIVGIKKITQNLFTVAELLLELRKGLLKQELLEPFVSKLEKPAGQL